MGWRWTSRRSDSPSFSVTSLVSVCACSHAGDVSKAKEYMRQSVIERIPHDKVTYNTLINVYARALKLVCRPTLDRARVCACVCVRTCVCAYLCMCLRPCAVVEEAEQGGADRE